MDVIKDTFRSVIDDYRVMLQIVASPTDNISGVIYNCNLFIVLAKTSSNKNHFEVYITI
jgi:hypothetical protein